MSRLIGGYVTFHRRNFSIHGSIRLWAIEFLMLPFYGFTGKLGCVVVYLVEKTCSVNDTF